MSDKKIKTSADGKETDYRLTRSVTQSDPKLKKQIEDNNEFARSTKTLRSPVSVKSGIFKFELGKRETDSEKRTLNKRRLTVDIGKAGTSKTGTKENIDNTSENLETPLKFYSPFPIDIDIPKNQNIQNLNKTINNSFKPEISLIDIEGINEQPKLIGNSKENSNNQQNRTFDFGNLLNETMAENQQALRLPLKHVANLVPEFDGKNISVNEYIGKLKHAKGIISDTDEPNLIPILKIKLKGDVYKALLNTKITSIDDFIKAIRKLYPSTENLHTLYGKLTEILQKPEETALSFANRLQDLVLQIKDLKNSEEGISDRALEIFETIIRNDALRSFKNGLRQEIRIELKEENNLDLAIQESIAIETRLKKQNLLRNSDVNIIWGRESEGMGNSKIYTCQICQDTDHEALFCDRAACVYCKGKDHLSYNCRIVKTKIKLICKFCNARGHSIERCKLNKLKGNHCQYCQVMGHTVTQCPFIIEYEVCWRCKETGHDPNTCTNVKNQKEVCEYCNSAEHITKDCPTSVCQRCNKVGHTIKYCPMLNSFFKFIMCSICNEQGHEASDCEEAKILVTQNRMEKNETKIVCQICNKIGHSGKNCREVRFLQQSTSNQNDYQNNYQNNNRNFNSYNKPIRNNNNFNYRGNNNNGNLNFTNRKFCDYCKGQNHNIEQCRKLENLRKQASIQENCSYCKEVGHGIETCKQIQELEKKAKQFCNVCKNTNHTSEQCFSRKNYLQQDQGNE